MVQVAPMRVRVHAENGLIGANTPCLARILVQAAEREATEHILGVSRFSGSQGKQASQRVQSKDAAINRDGEGALEGWRKRPTGYLTPTTRPPSSFIFLYTTHL